MTKQTNNIKNTNKFGLSTKLAIAFGAVLLTAITGWLVVLILVLLDKINAEVTENFIALRYVFYTIFIFCALCVSTWICMSTWSVINSKFIIQVNSKRYQVEVIVSSLVTALSLAIGSILLVSSVANDNWNLTIAASVVLLLSITSTIFGLICNIVWLVRTKKK